MTSPQQQGEKVPPEELRDKMLEAFENARRNFNDDRAYYESMRRPEAIGLAVPPEMRKLLAHVGYPRLYVDALSARLELEGFRLGGAEESDEELWDWFLANDLDVESILGHTDALVHGQSYVTVSMPDPKIDLHVPQDIPIIRVESPNSLYAEIDPRTRQVTGAIRAIYDKEGNEVISATLYTPNDTTRWDKVENEWSQISLVNHGLEMVPVVPIPNRTRLSDLYGTSEISPELRSVTDAAARVLMNMQGAAELMAVPQRLLFGVKPGELGVDPNTGQTLFDSYLARILSFEDPEGKVGQFAAAELRNFTEALDALDKKAAAYTGLPPQYLSTQSDQPSSAEAIKASESRLVKHAERKAKIFGGAWEQVMRVAYKVMKGGDIPDEYFRMESIWRDPSTPTYAAKADAASKLYNQGTGVIPKKRARKDMGYSEAEITEMEQWDEEENPLGLVGTLYGAGTPGSGAPGGKTPSDVDKPSQPTGGAKADEAA
jgi:hypothetical protein